jgi:transposase
LQPNDKKTATQKKDRIKQGHAFLRSRRKKHANKTKEELYEAIQKEEIVFITNIPEKDASAEEITEIYRERWKIEVFFRFLKQELHFSHLINRTENGIKSVMYITMTYAMILLAFKAINDLEGYKHVKRRFMMDAEYQRFVFVRKIMLSRPDVGKVFKPQFW